MFINAPNNIKTKNLSKKEGKIQEWKAKSKNGGKNGK
jgi:hypothetical protein